LRFQTCPGKKSWETPSQQKKMGIVVYTYHPSYAGRIAVHASLGKNLEPISKITRTKRARHVAQVIESLSSKCKTLSSNPSYSLKKKDSIEKLRS
jgi:hypothetical protein